MIGQAHDQQYVSTDVLREGSRTTSGLLVANIERVVLGKARAGRARARGARRQGSHAPPSRANVELLKTTADRHRSRSTRVVAPATRWVLVVVAAGAAGVLLCGCGGRATDGTWALPNSDLAGTRAATGSTITDANVDRLRVRWRFRFTAKPGFSGIFASTPVTDHDNVYVQDLGSNVFALDRSTGAVR